MPNATAEAIRKIPDLTPDFADASGRIRAVVQCFLVKSNGRYVLIDTCNGNQKRRPDMPEWGGTTTDFLARFRNCGIDVHQVDTVVCTHMHFDHIGWNTVLHDGVWEPTFPNARYVFVRDEYDFWVQGPRDQIVSDLEAFQDSVLPIVEAGQSQLVDADYKVDEHIRLIPTAGHTPGHVCVEVKSNKQRALIIGDLVYHPCQIVNPTWVTDSDQAAEKSIESRLRIFNEVADTDCILLGAHFPDPVAVTIIRSGRGYGFRRFGGRDSAAPSNRPSLGWFRRFRPTTK
jgi:glyoxylase-like metal-dependent hydrolase (beta-lactamase superfamily II)